MLRAAPSTANTITCAQQYAVTMACCAGAPRAHKCVAGLPPLNHDSRVLVLSLDSCGPSPWVLCEGICCSNP